MGQPRKVQTLNKQSSSTLFGIVGDYVDAFNSGQNPPPSMEEFVGRATDEAVREEARSLLTLFTTLAHVARGREADRPHGQELGAAETSDGTDLGAAPAWSESRR